MSNTIRKDFSISGLLAFSPEYKYDDMANVKLFETQSPNIVPDITLDSDKKLQEEHDDIKHPIKFVNLSRKSRVENVPPRVNVKLINFH